MVMNERRVCILCRILLASLKGGLRTIFSLKYVFFRHFLRILSHRAPKSTEWQSYDELSDFFMSTRLRASDHAQRPAPTEFGAVYSFERNG